MHHGHKNLLFIHLESISWQTLNAFPESFPNLLRIMPSTRRFRSYFSSATSTQMVMTSLLHGNSFELDAAPGLARPAANNPSLFSILDSKGYRTEFLGVSAFNIGPMLPLLASSLPPVWTTDDFAELLAKFETAIAQGPFAIYVWNLVTHIGHAIALESFSDSIDDLVSGACAVADRIVGELFDLLERHGVLDETVVVMFGDHGDDYWTHGFKRGVTHGAEPYPMSPTHRCSFAIRHCRLSTTIAWQARSISRQPASISWRSPQRSLSANPESALLSAASTPSAFRRISRPTSPTRRSGTCARHFASTTTRMLCWSARADWSSSITSSTRRITATCSISSSSSMASSRSVFRANASACTSRRSCNYMTRRRTGGHAAFQETPVRTQTAHLEEEPLRRGARATAVQGA